MLLQRAKHASNTGLIWITNFFRRQTDLVDVAAVS
jgi:hypothetical protein